MKIHRTPQGSGYAVCVVCSDCNGTMKFDYVSALNPARHAGDV